MVNKYYQKHKERHQREARERYQNLSKEEKDKRRKKPQERHFRDESCVENSKNLAFEIFFGICA